MIRLSWLVSSVVKCVAVVISSKECHRCSISDSQGCDMSKYEKPKINQGGSKGMELTSALQLATVLYNKKGLVISFIVLGGDSMCRTLSSREL